MTDQRTALLIIDVQEAMFSYPNDKLHDETGVMERIVSLLNKARRKGVPVVYVQHTSDEEYTKGTTTWQISSQVTPLEGEIIVEKPTWDAFHLTTLDEELQKLGITNLVIAGMQTEFCLDTTCRRSYSLGYSSVLVEDAHSTFDQPYITSKEIIQHHNRMLGGRFVTLKRESEVQF
ncbi:MAG: cysteine hydrolase [Paenibacillus sp.]|nr:cysteine hydrolase [Paenibacillus sp.]